MGADAESITGPGPLAQSDRQPGFLENTLAKVQSGFDTLFPPEKRDEWWERFKAFASSHPKITAFLLTNIVLSGPPLLLFAVFTITVFVVSLVSALLIGLLAALLFTVFMVLVALFVVLPTVFMTTMGATFIFLWGLGGYYIFKWFNDGTTPTAVGNAVGDKLNTLTGGNLSWLMDSARGKVESVGVEVPGKEQVEHVPMTNEKSNGLSGGSFADGTTGQVKGAAGKSGMAVKSAVPL